MRRESPIQTQVQVEEGEERETKKENNLNLRFLQGEERERDGLHGQNYG